MKRFLAGLLATALAAPLFARGSTPTCTAAPTDVLAVYNLCPEDPISVPAESVLVTWVAPPCGGITKYALELTIYFQGGEFCGDPAFSETFNFTSPDATPSIVIPLSELPPVELWCHQAVIRVKALTAPSGGNNKSQNNRFSDPSDAFEIFCGP